MCAVVVNKDHIPLAQLLTFLQNGKIFARQETLFEHKLLRLDTNGESAKEIHRSALRDGDCTETPNHRSGEWGNWTDSLHEEQDEASSSSLHSAPVPREVWSVTAVLPAPVARVRQARSMYGQHREARLGLQRPRER